MPFDIAEVVNNFADKLLNSPTLLAISKNPIYTALLICAVICVIIALVFQGVGGVIDLTVKAGVWIFLALIFFLFLHNRVLLGEIKEAEKNEAFDGIFNGSFEDVNFADALTY